MSVIFCSSLSQDHSLMALEEIPQFEAKDQDGNVISNNTLLGKPSVIFFYPKNFTAGCTKEACAFRDAYQDLEDVGATVIGVSKDDAESHQKFREQYNLPYQSIPDHDNKLAKLFGVKRDLFGLIPGRETYVFDSKGRLILQFRSQLKFDDHVQEAITAIQESLKNV